jgi:hypothetical protein
MMYKYSDAFKEVIIRLLVVMLVLQIVMLIWIVRRDQRESTERAARITQFQQQYITCDATNDMPGWIGGCGCTEAPMTIFGPRKEKDEKEK